MMLTNINPNDPEQRSPCSPSNATVRILGPVGSLNILSFGCLLGWHSDNGFLDSLYMIVGYTYNGTCWCILNLLRNHAAFIYTFFVMLFTAPVSIPKPRRVIGEGFKGYKWLAPETLSLELIYFSRNRVSWHTKPKMIVSSVQIHSDLGRWIGNLCGLAESQIGLEMERFAVLGTSKANQPCLD